MTSPERGAHTAGPWRVESSIYEHMTAEIVGDGRGIAQVWCGPNAMANARLMASAPTMLDTIRTTLVDVERATACTPIGSAAETILDDVVIRLRDAVAAAEGGGR